MRRRLVLLVTIRPHELTKHLSNESILHLADTQKAIAEIGLHSDAYTGVLHTRECSQWMRIYRPHHDFFTGKG